MTSTQITRINAAIALRCGWQKWKQTDESGTVVLLRKPNEARAKYWLSCGYTLTDEPLTFDKSHLRTIVPSDLPPYYTSLDACHEMEKVLKTEEEKR